MSSKIEELVEEIAKFKARKTKLENLLKPDHGKLDEEEKKDIAASIELYTEKILFLEQKKQDEEKKEMHRKTFEFAQEQYDRHKKEEEEKIELVNLLKQDCFNLNKEKKDIISATNKCYAQLLEEKKKRYETEQLAIKLQKELSEKTEEKKKMTMEHDQLFETVKKLKVKKFLLKQGLEVTKAKSRRIDELIEKGEEENKKMKEENEKMYENMKKSDKVEARMTEELKKLEEEAEEMKEYLKKSKKNTKKAKKCRNKKEQEKQKMEEKNNSNGQKKSTEKIEQLDEQNISLINQQIQRIEENMLSEQRRRGAGEPGTSQRRH